jgi:hypothetical protein
MNIGIFFDSTKSQGGIYHHNVNLINIFKKYLPEHLQITYIANRDEPIELFKKNKCKYIKLNNNFFTKLEKFFFKFSFVQETYNKLKITNFFEKFIKKNKFDLIFFSSPHEMVTMVTKNNFIIYLLSMQHKTLNFFPEYNGSHHNFNLRDHIISVASNRSFKILVGAHKDKVLLNNFYNTDLKKIIVQPYTFTLPYVYENNKDHDYENTFEKFDIKKNKKIFLYPAQFWPHKNHKYIIDVALDFKNNKINDVIFIFSGFDKGNLEYIKKKIKEKNLGEYFRIFNYLSDLELISLYLKCFAVLMPTYVGHSVIPMYEAFYFKKNIFFTKGLADDNLIEFLSEIDINDYSSVRNRYFDILNNLQHNKNKLQNAKLYYNETFKEENMAKSFIKIFEEYKYIKERWKS